MSIPASRDQKSICCVGDMLRNSARFQIWGLLSIYTELSLSQLTDRLKMSKSNVHSHLQKLIESGIVIERIDESQQQINKNLKPKLYRLAEELDEDDHETDTNKEDKYKLEKVKDRLEKYLSFTEYHEILQQHWLEFLHSLETNINQGKVGDAVTKLQEIDGEVPPLSIISFYSKEQAEKFRKKVLDLYLEVEKEQEKVKHEKHLPEPYFVGFSLYPIKTALDNMSAKK